MKLLPGFKNVQMPLANLSALAEVTMINLPLLPMYAIGLEEYRNTLSGFQHPPSADEAEFELKIWHYNPLLFSEDGTVDPFSLCLSLRESPDDRIQIALEELMRQIQYFGYLKSSFECVRMMKTQDFLPKMKKSSKIANFLFHNKYGLIIFMTFFGA